jgi:nitroreductase
MDGDIMADSISATGERLSNAVLDNIYQRRSVRNFSDEEIPDEMIKELIRAGTYAPTAMNMQPWRFVVVKNRQLIAEYDERAKRDFIALYKDTKIPELSGYLRNMSKPEMHLFYGAPVLVLIFASSHLIGEHDCALAAENMMLAAQSFGIGSCWIGLAVGLGNDVEFLKEVGVPEGHKLVAPLIFGYPAKGSLKAPARNADVILKWIR